MTPPDDAKLVIEPFDPEKHDRTAFSCGVEQVDNFFKRTANKLAKAGKLRGFVLVDADHGVIGFHAINAHAIDYQELPKPFARSRPRHGSIPAAYISMIGVDRRHAGHGYGGDLLADALQRIALASESLGIAVVVLDVLDDGNPDLTARSKKLYEGYGFTPFKSNPLRMFLPLATVWKMLGEDEPPTNARQHHTSVGGVVPDLPRRALRNGVLLLPASDPQAMVMLETVNALRDEAR